MLKQLPASVSQAEPLVVDLKDLFQVIYNLKKKEDDDKKKARVSKAVLLGLNVYLEPFY